MEPISIPIKKEPIEKVTCVFPRPPRQALRDEYQARGVNVTAEPYYPDSFRALKIEGEEYS